MYEVSRLRRRWLSHRHVVAFFLALALLVSFAATPAAAQASQEDEQEGESGEANLSSDTSQTGDNSNQCVGEQAVANTGNAQYSLDVLIYTPAGDQYTKRIFSIDDLEFEEVGSTIEVIPENSTECTQEVNQAASAASDTSDEGYCTWPYYDYWYGWVCQWSTDGTLWYWDYNVWDPNAWDYTLGQWGAWGAWVPYVSWTAAASDAAMGVLGTAGGLITLGVLGTLGLAGTSLLVRRRTRGS